MKNFLTVKLLYTVLYQCPTLQCINIRYNKFFKECFFYFKTENRLLKNTYLIFLVKETGHSLNEAVLPA